MKQTAEGGSWKGFWDLLIYLEVMPGILCDLVPSWMLFLLFRCHELVSMGKSGGHCAHWTR